MTSREPASGESAEPRVKAALASLGLDEKGTVCLLRYGELLVEEAIPLGHLGPNEADRVVDRHLLDAAALAAAAGTTGRSVADVGSGAGLPGIALACLGATEVVLIESDQARAAFLDRVLLQLELQGRVVAERAEIAARREDLRDRFDVGTARALAAPRVALELVLGFVRPGGLAAVSVGASFEIDDAVQRAASDLGGGRVRLSRAGDGVGGVLIVPKENVTPDRYPRRVGIPAKRPLS